MNVDWGNDRESDRTRRCSIHRVKHAKYARDTDGTTAQHVDGERAPAEGRVKGCQVEAWGMCVGRKYEAVQHASRWGEVLQIRHA